MSPANRWGTKPPTSSESCGASGLPRRRAFRPSKWSTRPTRGRLTCCTCAAAISWRRCRSPRMCGRPWNGCPCASTRTWSLRRRCSWTRRTSWSSSRARHGTSNGAAGPRPRPSVGSTSLRKSGATRLAKAGPNGKSSWTWPSGFGPTPRSISTSAMPRRSGKRSRRSFRCTTEFSGSRRRATRSNGAGPVCAKAGDSRIRTDGRVSAPFGRRPSTSLRAGSS